MPLRPSLGALELSVPPGPWAAGAVIEGTVSLALTAATSARRLVVGLVARQRAVGAQGDGLGLQLSYRNDKVWELQRELDGPRRYQPGERHAFALPLPEDLAAPGPGAPLDEAARALSRLSEVKRFPLEWRLYAFLDRPWHLSPRAEQAVAISPLAPASAPAATPRRRRRSTPKRARAAKRSKR